jgi:alpha,alpha-trehalose phosphorylase
VDADQARYELLEGEDLEIVHHGKRLTVTAVSPEAHDLPPAVERSAPAPPPGRAPPRRHRDA